MDRVGWQPVPYSPVVKTVSGRQDNAPSHQDCGAKTTRYRIEPSNRAPGIFGRADGETGKFRVRFGCGGMKCQDRGKERDTDQAQLQHEELPPKACSEPRASRNAMERGPPHRILSLSLEPGKQPYSRTQNNTGSLELGTVLAATGAKPVAQRRCGREGRRVPAQRPDT